MRFLTQDAVLVCDHQGKLSVSARQDLVSIAHRKVLVETDPEGCSISGCPNSGPTILPCTSSLPVQAGYSDFLRVDGRRICLDTVTGFTVGTPPGVVKYTVQSPGQAFVEERG